MDDWELIRCPNCGTLLKTSGVIGNYVEWRCEKCHYAQVWLIEVEQNNKENLKDE